MNYKYYLKFLLNKNKREIVTCRYTSIRDVNWDVFLNEKDIVIFDFDDTLSGSGIEIGEESVELLDYIMRKNVKIAIVSNSSRKKIEILGNKGANYKGYFVTKANKPDPANYRKILKEANISVERSIVVGDKVATDLYPAFLLGIAERVLVNPYSESFKIRKPNFLYRMLRFLENWFSTNR